MKKLWRNNMNSKRIYLSPPHMSGEELTFIHEAFESNWIAPIGPQVDAFEKEFCELTGASHAAAVSSGTAALHLALMISGIKSGDEVACSSFTFAGSAFPIIYQGATPVFIDSEEESWNMDPQLLDDAVKDRLKKGKQIKAVIVVHLYGQSANLDPIIEICKRNDLLLIEDAAESLGATYKGRNTGTLGPIGIFSFNGNKIVTTSGGGMLVSSDKKTVDNARFFATQARDPAPHYEHSNIGYNYRMSNVLAAIGRGQLRALNARINRKRSIFEAYRAALSSFPGIGFMPEATFGKSNRWLTCITVDPLVTGTTAEAIRLALEANNIESRPLWKPMHLQPAFKGMPAFLNGVSKQLFLAGLCLPSGTAMLDSDIERVISIIKDLK
jgi:dTDP-4-amino-4,6-dideoxygalactose transaminase